MRMPLMLNLDVSPTFPVGFMGSRYNRALAHHNNCRHHTNGPCTIPIMLSLLANLVSFSFPVLNSRRGGIGRRAGLKI